MTLAEAIDLRRRALDGKAVLALDLQEAIRVIQISAVRASGSKSRDRFHLPRLDPLERERANGILLFNLGAATRRRIA